jgi:hypothetical protein
MNSSTDDLKKLSQLLDSKFEGPLGVRFGIDGILGLFPIIGDLVTSGLSLYIIMRAASLGCGPSTLVRMGGNVFIDNLADGVPLLGNFFDFYWKANDRNMRLLENHLRDPKAATWKSRLVLAFVCFTLMAVLVVSISMTISLLRWIF